MVNKYLKIRLVLNLLYGSWDDMITSLLYLTLVSYNQNKVLPKVMLKFIAL
jgi:hypothetical protein